MKQLSNQCTPMLSEELEKKNIKQKAQTIINEIAGKTHLEEKSGFLSKFLLSWIWPIAS